MSRFLLVCFGGALGTGARYLVSAWIASTHGLGFPRATRLVNLLGSFLIGLVMELSLGGLMTEDTRLFLTTGCMGGFTTYSSFNQEVLTFASRRDWSHAGLYMSLTVVGALVCGMLAARALRGAPGR